MIGVWRARLPAGGAALEHLGVVEDGVEALLLEVLLEPLDELLCLGVHLRPGRLLLRRRRLVPPRQESRTSAYTSSMLIEFSSASSSSSCFAGVVGSSDAAGGWAARGIEGDHVLAAVPTSSGPRKVAGESGSGAASMWKPDGVDEKTEKDRSRCSSTEEALRVIPLPPRRGDGGCARDDSAKMAPTTTCRSTNHAAPDPSHSAAATIGARSLAFLDWLG